MRFVYENTRSKGRLGKRNEFNKRFPCELPGSLNLILDETHVPELFPVLLGGKSLLTTENGEVKRVIRHVFCYHCGAPLTPDVAILCCGCRRVICTKCAIRVEHEFYCLRCVIKLFQLNKREFKVLLAISCGIQEISKINEVTGILRQEIIDCLRKLKSLGFISRRGLSIFSEVFVTDSGASALSAYLKAYSQEFDVIEVLRKIQGRRGRGHAQRGR